MSPDVAFILVSFPAFADLDSWFIRESDKTLSNMILQYTVDWGKLVIKPGISENFTLSSHQSCLFTIQTATKG